MGNTFAGILGGWANKEKDPQLLADTARKLGFSALMINAGDDFAYLNDLCERARKAQIDIYYSFLITGTPKDKDWWQVVSPADAEILHLAVILPVIVTDVFPADRAHRPGNAARMRLEKILSVQAGGAGHQQA